MSKMTSCVKLLGCIAVCVLAGCHKQPAEASLFIRNVTVINPGTGSVVPATSVLVAHAKSLRLPRLHNWLLPAVRASLTAAASF